MQCNGVSYFLTQNNFWQHRRQQGINFYWLSCTFPHLFSCVDRLFFLYANVLSDWVTCIENYVLFTFRPQHLSSQNLKQKRKQNCQEESRKGETGVRHLNNKFWKNDEKKCESSLQLNSFSSFPVIGILIFFVTHNHLGMTSTTQKE